MALLNFHYGLKNTMPKAIVNGNLYVTTDERGLYVDLDSKRIHISDLVQLTRAEFAALTADTVVASALYYVIDANALYKYTGVVDGKLTWNHINSVAGVSELLGAADDAANASGSAFARIAQNASDITANATAIGTNTDAINAINDADNGILAQAKAHANQLDSAMDGRVDALEAKFGDGEGSVSDMIEAEAAARDTAIENAVVALTNNVYEVTSDSLDIDALTADLNPNPGDVLIVTSTANNIKSAYAYDESGWIACDGNVSADKVILKDNITMAGEYTQVGNLTKNKNGIKTFETAGKSVSAAFLEIFSKRLQPGNPTNPAVTLTFNEAKAYEVGTKVTPTYSASLSAGSYTYGPDTGITATAWDIDATNKGAAVASKTTASGSFDEITVELDTSYKIKATATHGAGAVAKDNLGDPSNPVKQIAAGSKSKDAGSITGFRSIFYGWKSGSSALANPEAITSAQVRALGNAATTTKVTSFSCDKMKQMFFAFPADTIKNVMVANATNGAPQTVYKKTGVMVEGANGYQAIAYDVFYVDNAAADGGANNYNITYEV